MTGAGNWTWLIPGRVPTLIDAGTGDPRHLEALASALGDAPLAQVLVTHAHADHASGAPVLAQRFPGVRFRKIPHPPRDARWPVSWEALAPGEVVEAGDTTLEAVHTPGHAPDHLCFWHAATRALFGGDLVVEGSTVWIPSLDGDLAAYLASLERILALAPARIYPAHGPIVDNPERLLRDYLAHRREREAQVLDALAAGDTTAEAMAARIYRGLQAALAPMAVQTIESHLLKLERERRVRRTQNGWELPGRNHREHRGKGSGGSL